MKTQEIVLICLIIFTTTSCQQNGCSISFMNKNDRYQPLFFTKKSAASKNYELFIPPGKDFRLKKGESIELFCPPLPKNSLTQNNQDLASATCVSGNTVKVNGREYSFESLACKQSVKAVTKETDTACANGKGNIINIGFDIPDSDKMLTVIKVCYDAMEVNPLYAEHILYGQYIEFGSDQSYRPGFSTSSIPKNASPANSYKQASQKTILADILGSQSISGKYVNENSFLARGHLAPDADFLFAGLQFATYFYINACPQWKTVNAGNWLAIETMVRKAAKGYKKPLRIITGSHGVSVLPDVNNKPQELYLMTGKRMPVPKFLWKIVYNESSKQGIAFVAVNDPFIKFITTNEMLCADICNAHGWHSQRWTDMRKGFVYCCDVKVLQKSIPTIPKIQVNSVLNNA